MKTLLRKLMPILLGDLNYYRLARFLWGDARRDMPNAMVSNGEFRLIGRVLSLASADKETVLFDVGANVGRYSEELLRQSEQSGLGVNLRLFSFEPNPACVESIKERLSPLGLAASSKIEQKVISDQPGQMDFYITGETAGSSSLRVDASRSFQKKIEVECVTLDAYCSRENISEILFLKIDTEGNDMRVLAGARALLERGAIRFAQFEYNYRWVDFRNFLKDVFDLVEPLGYKLAKVTEKGLEVYPRWHPELEVFREGNYLIGRDFEALGLPLLQSPVFLQAKLRNKP